MHSMNRFTAISATLLVSLLVTSVANAQRARDAAEEEAESQQTRQAQAVSKDVYDEITKAQELVEGEPPDYNGALRILNRLYDPDDLSEYEQANVLNYIGFVHYNMENVPEAIRTYELMIRIPSLEPQMAKQTTYTLAQLNMMEENYNDTLRLLNEWFVLETNPGPEPYILLAQVYYQLERYAEMVTPIETAMQVAERRQTEVKEDWYVLLNFAYFQQENYSMVRDIQKILLENWPEKRYWLSLAGAFTELGQDELLISAYHAIHTQGMLESEAEHVTMAQLFMQAEVPYKAAVLLETAMADGTVERDARNYRLLSQAWSLSQEDARAIPALREAARLSDDGELDIRLGNAYLNLAQYDDCVTSVRSGIRKGGLRSEENAQISLGMCLYNLREYSEARTAFQSARRTDGTRRMADQWIRVIDAEVERNRQIRLAQEAARRQQQEVERRRAEMDRA